MMADAYGIEGTMLIGLALAVVGFAISFLLVWTGLISSDAAQARIPNILALVLAAFAALAADVGASSGWLVELLGRAAIFGLVWFVGGLCFAAGAFIGSEKAKPRNKRDRT